MNTKKTIVAALALAGLATSALAGGPYELGDGNSTATFDTASGQINWTVDGVSQLFGQEFYFRRAGDTREYRLDSTNMSLDGVFATDTNPFTDTRDDTFGQLYSDGQGLQIETRFSLLGGTAGSGMSDLAEQIILRNNSNATMTISFFQFVDFDLGGDAFDDFGQIVGGNTAQQSDDDGFFISETVVTPLPALFQMGSSADLNNLFNDGAISNLDGTASFSGDVAWAFQWNITMAAGQSFLISKDKLVVPTPGTMALLGAAGFMASRRRRS
ncbi:MAG: hypothetical protein JKY96_07160 [Phycisphaerales bacterium]|nr:hypothetical protein [Phycisphaerales bacterium]